MISCAAWDLSCSLCGRPPRLRALGAHLAFNADHRPEGAQLLCHGCVAALQMRICTALLQPQRCDIMLLSELLVMPAVHTP